MRNFLCHHLNVLHFLHPMLVKTGMSHKRTMVWCGRYERFVHPLIYSKKRQVLAA